MENNSATKTTKIRFNLFIDGEDCGTVWAVDAKAAKAEIASRGYEGKISIRKAGTSLGKR
jgi:hypothetical protein